MRKRDNKQGGFCFGDFELFAAESAGLPQSAPADPPQYVGAEVDENGEITDPDWFVDVEGFETPEEIEAILIAEGSVKTLGDIWEGPDGGRIKIIQLPN